MPSANTVKTKKKARQAPDPASGAATKSPLPAVAERLPEPPGVLAGLGLQGWERVEHAVLASLVSEDPLLLIGLHGTGKSMLLERLADALHLTFRHYNASLICFDDLIGFPVPEPGSTTLKYLQTPATIWDAEAVFFDEVSRCKPDVQNKLFSILHERKVQGLPLERLRYRWSAMNPPPVSGEAQNYSGSQPLDSALADRYAFIVQAPDWCDLSEEAQRRLLLQDGGPGEAEAERLRQLVNEARPLWTTLRQQLAPLLTDYVRCVAALLKEAGIRLSPRRLAVLMRNIAAVHAVRWILGQGDTDLGESARLALIHSIPLPAEGIPAPEDKVECAHREAWHAVTGEKASALIRIYSERDPVRRAVMAAQAEEMDLQQRSVIVADCLQFLRDGARHAVAAYLMETGLAGRLMAPVAEEVAADYAMAAEPQQDFFSTHSHSEWRVAERLQEKLDCLRAQDAGHQALANLLVTLFSADRLLAEADVNRVCESWQRARAALESLSAAKG